MARARTMPKASMARSPSQALPIPRDWRVNFERISVCFDVTFSKSSLQRLAAELGTAAGDFYWAGATKSDVEAGVIAHQIGRAAERTLHVSFEFQANRAAPFPKVAARKLAKFVECLATANAIKLVHAEFAQIIPADFPVKFPEATVLGNGQKVVVTSFNYEVIDEGSDIAAGSGMRRPASGGPITINYWLKTSRAVDDLSVGFRLARELTVGQNTRGNGGS